MDTTKAVLNYLAEVRRIRGTGQGTDEQSCYPAIFALLDELVGGTSPARRAMAHPAGIKGSFPDVAIYEADANVVALPVEVKGASAPIDRLAKSSQAARYARTFGGGRVLVTNLWQFAIASERSDGSFALEVVHSVVATESALDNPASPIEGNSDDLRLMVAVACELRPSIREPSGLADLLAYHARSIRDSVNATKKASTLLGPIKGALHDGLGIDVEDELLVPTVVQTLVYGLFSAWLESEDPQDFDWVVSSFDSDVPVFAEVLHASLRPAIVRETHIKQHLDSTARVLMWTDRDAFKATLSAGAIEYFYEPFLAAFDSDLRDHLGVWFTPREVAEYQVARVDHHLRNDLGIPDGIAADEVIVLDPACGTGTYLAAVLRKIYATHRDNGEPENIAADRTSEAAYTRVIGFEILPAAFIICHQFVRRVLSSLGADSTGEFLRVYLTNSLTGWEEDLHLDRMELFPEMREELSHASHVKSQERVLVILGNPPYQGYAQAASEEEQVLLDEWIEPLWPVWGLRKHRLSDLYVRFWKVSIDKIASDVGVGVVSFITNRRWLGGRSFPTMREAVVSRFDRVVVDDLHGMSASLGSDESVFSTTTAAGIKVGTAIVTAVREVAPDGQPRNASVERRDIQGRASDKRKTLENWAANRSAIDSGLQAVQGVSKKSWWRLTDHREADGPLLDEYFNFSLSGVQTIRDEAVVAEEKPVLEARMKDYFDKATAWSTIEERYPGFAVKKSRYDGPKVRTRLLDKTTFNDDLIVPFLLRPFDRRWLYWEPKAKLLNEARRDLMPYFVSFPSQISFAVPQTWESQGAARPLATRCVASFKAGFQDARMMPLLGPKAGTGFVEDGLSTTAVQVPNVRKQWIEAARTAGIQGDDNAVAAVVFHAILGITSSDVWLATQATSGTDFPDVPLPKTSTELAAAAAIGERYAALCDPAAAVPGVTSGAIEPKYRKLGVADSSPSSPVLDFGRYGIEGGRYDSATGSILWDDGGGWRDVPEAVWNYNMIGFRAIPKWLAYRVGQPLSRKEREFVTFMVRRIQAITDLSAGADHLYLSAAKDPLA